LKRVRPGAAVFFALLALTLAAALLVVRARTPDLMLEETGALPTTFDPGAPGPPKAVRIGFFVRESDPAAVVEIVDSSENVVRTLDAGVALEAEEAVSYRWDGRRDDGALVPLGRYRLAVELPASDREMIWPQRITIGPEPPETSGDQQEAGEEEPR
jgi:hypothetical protein